jgi:hypothetical protein
MATSGFFESFLALFASEAEPARSTSEAPEEEGRLREGTVDYVGDAFLVLEDDGRKVYIFKSELHDGAIEDLHQHFTVGDGLPYVIVKPNPKRPGTWVGSHRAVPEARVRAVLAKLQPGTQVTGPVTQRFARGLRVQGPEFPVLVPKEELTWDPTGQAGEGIGVGDVLTVAIDRTELPMGWLEDRSKRKASAIGSARACRPRPQGALVEVPYSGLTFKVGAAARMPKGCDPLLAFVLEERCLGTSWEAIQAVTGLPALTLEAIRDRLRELDLLLADGPSSLGATVVQAMEVARRINEVSIGGLFASAAPTESQYQALAAGPVRAYPNGWARPVYVRKAEEQLLRANRDTFPARSVRAILGEEEQALLDELLANDRLNLFVQRARDAASYRYLPTPLPMLLTGLGKVLTPVHQELDPDMDRSSHCTQFLLIRMKALCDGAPFDRLCFEPVTGTLWLRGEVPWKWEPKPCFETHFPDLPAAFATGLRLPTGEDLTNLGWHYWFYLKVPER